MMLAGLGAADYQLATEKLLVVQFVDGPLRFLDGLHLDESKTFRALIVAIADNLGVLNVSNPVEQFEEIALGSVEGQIPHVQARRSDRD